MNHGDQAVQYLLNGFSCSEAIVLSYAEAYHLDRDIALRIAGGFGGGMATLKTCGAVTGALMIIGLKFGAGMSQDPYRRDLTYGRVQEFFHRFQQREGSTVCHDILASNAVNAANPQEMKQLRERHICDKIVQSSTVILDALLSEQE